jgi:hypothetical protein
MLGRRGQFSKKKIGGGPAHSSSRIRRAALGAASRARESAQSEARTCGSIGSAPVVDYRSSRRPSTQCGLPQLTRVPNSIGSHSVAVETIGAILLKAPEGWLMAQVATPHRQKEVNPMRRVSFALNFANESEQNGKCFPIPSPRRTFPLAIKRLALIRGVAIDQLCRERHSLRLNDVLRKNSPDTAKREKRNPQSSLS